MHYVALLLDLELGLETLARLSPARQLGVTSSLLMPLPTAGCLRPGPKEMDDGDRWV